MLSNKKKTKQTNKIFSFNFRANNYAVIEIKWENTKKNICYVYFCIYCRLISDQKDAQKKNRKRQKFK